MAIRVSKEKSLYLNITLIRSQRQTQEIFFIAASATSKDAKTPLPIKTMAFKIKNDRLKIKTILFKLG